MAQRLIFFKDHLRAALTMGTTRAQHERNLHPSHRRGSPHRRREPLCARKRTFSCDFNHPDITRTKRWKQPCQCKMQAWITKHTGSAAEIFQRSPPRSVPPIDAGSHYARKHTFSCDFKHPDITRTKRWKQDHQTQWHTHDIFIVRTTEFRLPNFL